MKEKAIKCDFCDKDSVDAYQDFCGRLIVYSCNEHHGKAVEKLRGGTDRNYDKGKEHEGKTYPFTEKNKTIYKQIEELEKKKQSLELEQRKLVDSLEV
jgi:hypothetical protein